MKKFLALCAVCPVVALASESASSGINLPWFLVAALGCLLVIDEALPEMTSIKSNSIWRAIAEIIKSLLGK